MRSLSRYLIITLLGATCLTTSGCLFGNSLSVTVFAGSVSISVGNVDISFCSPADDAATYSCINNSIFSTFDVLTDAELLFRLFLLDPLVLQMPAGAGTFAGSYAHTESSTSGSLAITTATSLRIDARRTLTAEPGTQFVILALPDGAPTTGTFSFNFNFTPPPGATSIDVKPIITGYAKLNDGTEFFPPIMPCISDMADATTLTIPLPVPGDTLTLPTLTADLGCHDEVYDLIPSLVGPFMCYGTKPSKGSAKFPKGLQTTLSDRFETSRIFAARKAPALCNPATVGTESGDDANTRLAGLVTTLAKATPKQPKHTRRTDLHVSNQFHPHGELVLDTKKASRLLIPAATGLVPPDPSTHHVDHFNCYDVKVSKGDPKFPRGLQATVTDAFTQPKTYLLKKPTRLCVPADRDATDPDAPAHADHLMCYGVKLAKTTPKQTKFVKVLGLDLSSALVSSRLDAARGNEVCVPSSVVP